MKKGTPLEAVVSLLAETGFKKRSGYVFTQDLAPGVLGWLGLNRAARHRDPGEFEINPVIGVRFQAVERLVAECRGEKFHAYQPPTASSPLGYLMPENRYMAWVFNAESSGEVATDMVNAIRTHGVAFMRSVVDMRELSRRLDDGRGPEHQSVYRRPAVALLAGEPEQASALLSAALDAIDARRTDLAAEDFRRFAGAFRKRLSSPHS